MEEQKPAISDRLLRQKAIDSKYVEPIWSKRVEVPVLEMTIAIPVVQSPIVLLPELRFTSTLKLLTECIGTNGKWMVVDTTNSRFELLRSQFSKLTNIYYSTQTPASLNYSPNVFNNVITEMSIPTALNLRNVIPEYSRVLRPGGRLILALPLPGSFPAFFDLLTESLLHLSRTEHLPLENYMSLTPESIRQILEQSGLHPEGNDLQTFEIPFPDAEKMLFSSLIETMFLSTCLNIPLRNVDQKQLLMLTVRAFHHYFEKNEFTVPMKIGLFSAYKI